MLATSFGWLELAGLGAQIPMHVKKPWSLFCSSSFLDLSCHFISCIKGNLLEVGGQFEPIQTQLDSRWSLLKSFHSFLSSGSLFLSWIWRNLMGTIDLKDFSVLVSKETHGNPGK
ncbi:hypothetical protein Pyn_33268 [Prunus yedoensis var. nudiflora]|uniref:Uncharacterized protein n=1 Tax=Prunus yedoensis var. nudiflora TaxID=2094558 RepID=A0A315ATM6_PRUYE|nr:hypothetical protein Pyn_33268 [Prunus yedoensis var. nudiflora]